jgi:propionyl-CoA synthetase
MPQEHPQDQVYQASISDPETFWSRQAEQIHWHRNPSKAFTKTTKYLKKSNISHEHWGWFTDGEISTTYNCVDRHVLSGNGDNVAIFWDSPVTRQKEQYTYKQLLQEVETLAGVLREEGVKKGDVVLIYMPMIPASLFAMLAIARLGAIHAVVFGGFSPTALAQRIEASRPVAIMTASCGIEGGKGPTAYVYALLPSRVLLKHISQLSDYRCGLKVMCSAL